MACFESGQNKKQELPVKKSGSDRVTAGKTVTGPVNERAFDKGPLPMHSELQPFVQQHARYRSSCSNDEAR